MIFAVCFGTFLLIGFTDALNCHDDKGKSVDCSGKGDSCEYKLEGDKKKAVGCATMPTTGLDDKKCKTAPADGGGDPGTPPKTTEETKPDKNAQGRVKRAVTEAMTAAARSTAPPKMNEKRVKRAATKTCYCQETDCNKSGIAGGSGSGSGQISPIPLLIVFMIVFTFYIG